MQQGLGAKPVVTTDQQFSVSEDESWSQSLEPVMGGGEGRLGQVPGTGLWDQLWPF